MDKMEAKIKRFMQFRAWYYSPVEDYSILDVYDILFNNKKIKDSDDSIINFYMAISLHHQRKYDKMPKYLVKAINKNYVPAMNIMANFYENIQDYNAALNYYLMAMNLGCKGASGFIGDLYEKQGDIENMLKYFLIGVENKDVFAIILIGEYYYRINDFDNMIKYFLMGFELGDPRAARNLGIYYKECNETEKMIYYYKLAIEGGDKIAMNILGLYYHNIGNTTDHLKYSTMAYKNGSHIAAWNMALHYQKIGKLDEAIKFFQKGAKWSNLKCCMKLAQIYPDQKMKYYLQAMDVNYAQVKNKLIIDKMNTEEINQFLNILCYQFRSDFVCMLDTVLKIRFDNLIGLKYFEFLKRDTMMQVLKNIGTTISALKHMGIIDDICNKECEICMNTRKQINLKCKHSLCYKCLYECLDKNLVNCPFCRTKICY